MYTRSICIGGTWVTNTYIWRTYIGGLCIRSIYIRGAYIRSTCYMRSLTNNHYKFAI